MLPHCSFFFGYKHLNYLRPFMDLVPVGCVVISVLTVTVEAIQVIRVYTKRAFIGARN
jgi:hypothetical protein